MEKVKLGKIFEYLPKSKFKAGDGKERGKYKFFTSSNIQNKFIDEFIYDGEYLIFGTGGKASINYCNDKFSTSTDNFVVKVNKEINTKLIFLYFQNNMEKLEKGFKGASIKHISKEYINQLMIPKYNYQQQLEIVSELDKIQEIIDIRKEQIEHLDELIKSQFVEMFGDIENNSKRYGTLKLSEISKCLTGGTPSTSHSEYYQGNIPWITTVSLGKNYIDEKDAVSFITEDAINNSSTKIINESSILFGTRVGVGKSSINKVKICTNQDIVAITNISQKYNLLFLKHLLDQYNKYFESQKRGVTIKGIKSETLKNINIPIIDINIQNKFADFVKQFDKQKFELQNSLKKIERLKESLMNKYFG